MKSVTFYGMVGNSAVMQRLYARIRRVAPYNIPVLISGESGTGKELVARAIHSESDRRTGPFHAVNTGALTPELINSELFGHEKGAFTGATDRKRGFFEAADGGTLFLDEIGTMEPSTQVNLLRVIESRQFMRVGGTESQETDVRILAATNINLKKAIAQGDFRRDLYYRLNVFSLRLPALRHRTDDIPLLVEHFRQNCVSQYGLSVTGVEPAGLELLVSYSWPGNVRELANVVTQLVIGSGGPVITAAEVTDILHQSQSGRLPGETPSPSPSQELEASERSRTGNANATTDKAAAHVGSAGPDPAAGSPAAHTGSHSIPGERTIDHHAVGSGSSESETAFEAGTTIEAAERELIIKTLDAVEGNRSKAARMLGISRKSLYNKLKSYEIEN